MGLFDKLKSKVKDTVTDKLSELANKEEQNSPEKNEEFKDDEGNENDNNRPDGVPVEASWNDDNDEWEMGENNAQGIKIGEWKYWLEEGTLACHTIHEGETGQDFTFSRFHPDGTYSQKGTYKNGVNDGEAHYQRSINETNENSIPPQAPDNVFRMIYNWDNGQITSSQLFDADGDELDQHGNLLNPQKRGDIPEDAIWNAEEGEWEVKTLVNGVLNGLTTGWNSRGEKASEVIYDNDVLLKQTLFHPDGTIAYIEEYEKDMPFMKYRMHCKSLNDTDQGFPQGLAPETFKLEYLHNEHGFMTSWKTTDHEGNTLQETPVYSNLENRIPNTKFNSFEEASEIWNEKGADFYKNMNWWLSQYYAAEHNVPEGTPEPYDERQDMERVVLEALEKLNAEGQPEKARALFHPSYEPISKFTWQNLGQTVSNVISIDDQNALAMVSENCFLLSGTKINKLNDVLAIGSSKNKSFIAKAYSDRIEVTKGLNGSVTKTFKYPTTFSSEIHEQYPTLNTAVFNSPQHLGITDIKVSSDGSMVLLVSRQGTFLLTENKVQHVYPHLEKMQELVHNFEQRTNGNLADYLFEINSEYPNADFSIDDKYIVVGGMLPAPVLAGTCIFALEGESLKLKKYGEPDSMFGIVNEFHTNGTDMIHAACMYGSINTNWSATMNNTSFRLGVGQIELGEVELDNFAGAYMQAPGMVRAVCPLGDGFVIGNNQGYIWWYNQSGELAGHTHIGGTIRTMDITADKKYLLIGTDEGQIIKLKINEKRGEGMITDMNVEDVQRYIFLRSFKPMAW